MRSFLPDVDLFSFICIGNTMFRSALFVHLLFRHRVSLFSIVEKLKY